MTLFESTLANKLPRLQTNRTVATLLAPHHAAKMAQFRQANRKFLKPWEPTRSEAFYTTPFWQTQLRAAIRDYRYGSSACLVILDSSESEVLGVCNYTSIVHGTFESCHLGYSMAEQHQGKGIMYEVLQASNTFIFEHFDLHRIMANYMPHNERSGALLSRLGFEKEGLARSYLKIDGQWQDHVLTSLVKGN